jgi:hypothetical protein
VHFFHWNFLVFLPLDPDPDSQYGSRSTKSLNPDPIRSGSGSTTLPWRLCSDLLKINQNRQLVTIKLNIPFVLFHQNFKPVISLKGGDGETRLLPLKVDYSLRSTFSCRPNIFYMIEDSIHEAVKVRPYEFFSRTCVMVNGIFLVKYQLGLLVFTCITLSVCHCWGEQEPHGATNKDWWNQFCGSGMFYPGSRIRIPNFLFRIWIPDPGGWKSTGSRILLYIKIGMKNKTNIFLAFYSFRSKFY